MRDNKTAFFADVSLFVITCFWGTSFAVIKHQIDAIDPVTVLFYRFAIATVLLGLYLLIKRAAVFEKFHYGFFSGLLLGLPYLTQMIGLRYTTAANSAFITSLFVVFVPLFSFFFFKIVPTAKRLVAVLLAVLGLWLLTGGLATINVGDLLTLITALAYGGYIVQVDVYTKRVKSTLVLAFQQFLVTTILCAVYMLVTDLSFEIPTCGALLATLYLSLFATLLATTVQIKAQRYTSPMKASIIFTMEPVIAAALAWTWGGEEVTMAKALGGASIVLAMLVSELPWPNKVSVRESQI